MLVIFSILLIELILPEYAKKGSPEWIHNKGFYSGKGSSRWKANKKWVSQRSNTRSRDPYWHHKRILSDPWFFQMAKIWKKTDSFFLQKWEQSHQPWTYRGRINEALFLKQEIARKDKRRVRLLRLKRLRVERNRRLHMRKWLWLKIIFKQSRSLKAKCFNRVQRTSFKKLMDVARILRYTKRSVKKVRRLTDAELLKNRQKKLHIELQKINEGPIKKLYLAEKKRAKRWNKVKFKEHNMFRPVTITRPLLKIDFGPHINFLKKIEPSFFSLARLLRFKYSSVSNILDKMMSQIHEEQALLVRWNKIAAFDQLDILRHSRSNPASQYWNIQKLQRCLRNRPKLLRKNAVIDSDAIVSWYKNYKQVTLIMQGQDITYEETLLWFERHPWLIKHPHWIPMNPSAFIRNSFSLMQLQNFNVLSSRQLQQLYDKRSQVLSSTVKFGLFAALERKKKVLKQRFDWTERSFIVVKQDLQQILISTVITCLLAYPKLRVSNATIVWNFVLRYVIAEIDRNTRILKAALNNLRVIHIVESLKRIIRQLSRGSKVGFEYKTRTKNWEWQARKRRKKATWENVVSVILENSPLEYLQKQGRKFLIWYKLASVRPNSALVNKRNVHFQTALEKHTGRQLISAAKTRFPWRTVFHHVRRLRKAQVLNKVMDMHISLVKRIYYLYNTSHYFSVSRYWYFLDTVLQAGTKVSTERNWWKKDSIQVRAQRIIKKVPVRTKVKAVLKKKLVKNSKKIGNRKVNTLLTKKYSLKSMKRSFKSSPGAVRLLALKKIVIKPGTLVRNMSPLNVRPVVGTNILKRQIGFNRSGSYKKSKTSCFFELAQRIKIGSLVTYGKSFWNFYTSLNKEKQERLVILLYFFDLAWSDLPGVFFNRGWYNFCKNMRTFRGRYKLGKKKVRPSIQRYTNKKLKLNRLKALAFLKKLFQSTKKSTHFSKNFQNIFLVQERKLCKKLCWKVKKLKAAYSQKKSTKARSKKYFSRSLNGREVTWQKFMSTLFFSKFLSQLCLFYWRKAFLYSGQLQFKAVTKIILFKDRVIAKGIRTKLRLRYFSLLERKFLRRNLRQYNRILLLAKKKRVQRPMQRGYNRFTKQVPYPSKKDKFHKSMQRDDRRFSKRPSFHFKQRRFQKAGHRGYNDFSKAGYFNKKNFQQQIQYGYKNFSKSRYNFFKQNKLQKSMHQGYKQISRFDFRRVKVSFSRRDRLTPVFGLLKKKYQYWKIYSRVPWRRRRRIFKRNRKFKSVLSFWRLKRRLGRWKKRFKFSLPKKKVLFLVPHTASNLLSFNKAFTSLVGFNKNWILQRMQPSHDGCIGLNKRKLYLISMVESAPIICHISKKILKILPKATKLHKLAQKLLVMLVRLEKIRPKEKIAMGRIMFPIYPLPSFRLRLYERLRKKLSSKFFLARMLLGYFTQIISQLKILNVDWTRSRHTRQMYTVLQKWFIQRNLFFPRLKNGSYFLNKNFMLQQSHPLKLKGAEDLPFFLWKEILPSFEKNEPTMRNLLSYAPGFYSLNTKFSMLLFSFYVRSLSEYQTKLLKVNLPEMRLRYKLFLFRYILLLQSFYKNYYLIKKSKTLPTHYGLYLIYKYLYLTGQLDIGFLNRKKDRRSRLLKIVYVTRYIKRKSMGAVRKKKNLFKLKTLFDRLFFWLYRISNVSFLIGSKVKYATVLPSWDTSQFLYRKRIKFLV